jgi:Tfp pilus assembly protein PilW
VEELEVAMDTMEGIAEDGSDIVDGLAREARIRSVYLGWCKENGKEPDEARFPTFSSNFLAMEEYAKESGKEMTLNQYADCSEDEYLMATSPSAEEDAKATAEAAIAEAKAAIAQVDAKKEEEEEAKAKAEAKKKADTETTAKKEAEAKAKKEAEAKAKKEAEGKTTS